MAQTVQLKRSSVASKVPLTTDLSLGELAINTYDGNLFFKKDPGTPAIVTVATLDGTQTFSGTKTFTGGAYFTEIVSRAVGSTEGGQLVLGYANNTTVTGQGNSTWNIDVQDFTNQKLRFLRVNSSGATDVAMEIPDTGAITVNRSITIGTNGISANGTFGSAGQVLATNGSAVYWTSAGSGGATNIGSSANSSAINITSSSGTGTTLIASNNTVAGVMTAVAQTIGGAKSFTDGVITSSLSNSTTLNINTTAAVPVTISTNGTERMRIDASGNLGLGVTPSAWETASRALQLGTTTSMYTDSIGGTFLNNNVYRSATTETYLTTAAASMYQQYGGGHFWYKANSGTVGTGITFTRPMTIHPSGGVSIGNTTDPGGTNLSVSGTIAGTSINSSLVNTINLGAATYNDAIRIKSGTESAGNPFMYLKKNSATGFTIGGFGTAAEGNLTLSFPGGIGIDGGVDPDWAINSNISVLQSRYTSLQTVSSANGSFSLAQNAVAGSGGWIYTNPSNDGSSLYQTYYGGHAFFTSPAGTVGTTVPYNTAMVMDKSGKVAIGSNQVTSPLNVTGTALGDLIDTVRIAHSNAGATYGPTLNIQRDSASPAASDAIGRINFRGTNSSAGVATYAFMQGSIVTPTATTEDGQLGIGVWSGGNENTVITVYPSSATVNGSFTATSSATALDFMVSSDSVTSPGHTWSSDTGTGLFRKAAATIGVAISGTEELKIDSTGMFALNATSGYSQAVTEWVYRRTTNGAAIGSAIADVFTSPSSLSLEASSVYEFNGVIYFLKTTAGTATWTNVFSSAPTLAIIDWSASAVGGMAATTAAAMTQLTGTAYFQNAASLATAPSASTLTTGVNHYFRFRGHIQTNASCNWRLRLTQGAGTATPLAGSYYTIRKVAASTGTFAA